jgi:hypothetical protein
MGRFLSPEEDWDILEGHISSGSRKGLSLFPSRMINA